MAADTNCHDCGSPIPEGQPKGLCSRCALKGALDLSATADALTPALSHPMGEGARRAGEGGEGRPFGDYELLEEIARGGMGIVFKARQRKLDRIVAVKMILAGEFASREQALRFRVEAEAAARLQHPSIVRIHETGEQDGQPYFSMDYVEGGNLARLVREKPLPARRAAGYVKTIAEAIHYAHEQGILHRDLKPSNVLIDHADQPRVTDFGLAKRMTKESFLTVTGDVMGSPGFMPPEQCGYRSSRREEAQAQISSERGMRNAEEGSSLVISAATKVRAGRYSDVYGLGAILFYLVTGRPPFVAENVAETLHHILNTEPVSPRLLNPSVPQDIGTICLKCLEKEPAKRYQTAQQLADELGRFLNDELIHARPTIRAERIWRWCKRKPALAIAIAAILLVALTGIAGIAWQWQKARENYSRLAIAMAENELITLAVNGGPISEIITGPKTRVQYFVQDTNGKRLQLTLDENSLVKSQNTRGSNTPNLKPEFFGAVSTVSPRGDMVLSVVHTNNRATVREFRSGRPLTPELPYTGRLNTARFSPDSRLLATGDSDANIRIWDIRAGLLLAGPLVPDGSSIMGLRFTEDGKHMVSLTARNTLTVWETRHWRVRSSRQVKVNPPLIQIQGSIRAHYYSTPSLVLGRSDGLPVLEQYPNGPPWIRVKL